MIRNSNNEVFARRRKHFMEAMGDALAILPSALVSVRSADVEFIYRHDNDFYYLTGFAEPESIAMFAPGENENFVLFVRPRDKERETWTGRRSGIEGAMSDYGAGKAYVTDEFQRVAARYLEKAERIYYPLGVNERVDARMLEMVKNAAAMRPRVGSGPNALLDPREI
ncbi:MAG: aminopeptidase P N-terminal domain-containing protein, partial [Deltaproteobacteria bacterium]|nr:aminopeptidase P N-terminal domain-containing protein [Deltaproteobacteria bacterium]